MITKKLLAKKILENCSNFDWSIQGFGMLRLYLDDETRLHIWDSRYQVEDVSIIHTHPWHFRSEIVAGIMHNSQLKYQESSLYKLWRELIVTGEKATAVNEGGAELVGVAGLSDLTYTEGDTYFQDMQTPHKTIYEDGTVTIISRSGRLPNNHAYSFWPESMGPKGWVSAAPRKATEAEVNDICAAALHRWF